MIRLLLILISTNLSFYIYSDIELINYQIKKNDTLFSIANSFNTDLDDIYVLNPNIGLSQDYIKPGQDIVIPVENNLNYSKYCSYTGGIGDAKNIKISFKDQLNNCIKFLSNRINTKDLDNQKLIDWDLINQNKLYQIFINNMVSYLIRYDENSKDLDRYIDLLHQSALNKNEISIMGLYANEALLDSRDSPDIPFVFPDKYEAELNGLAEKRRKIFSNWENLKYQDHWVYGYFNPDFSFDSFCDEVINKPSTNNYMLLLNANNECASYFDGIGSNKWKIFTDRIIELIKKNDTEFIYPDEYEIIVSIMYYSDINNILDYYEAFMDIFVKNRCKSCNDAEELFDFMEAYEDLGEVSYGQADAMRYIRMNHVEYLSEKYFWDSKEITLWGDDLIELIDQDIAYIKDKILNKEEDDSSYLGQFQLTYLDANTNIFNQLVNDNSCTQALKFYNQFKMLDRKVISDFIYTELNESEFLLPFELANCFISFNDDEIFIFEKHNFNLKKAKDFLAHGLIKFKEYIKFIEENGVEVQQSEVIIYEAYHDILNAYIHFLDKDELKSIDALEKFKDFEKKLVGLEIQSMLFPIFDKLLVKYVDLYINLELNKFYPNPYKLKIYKDNLINSIKVSTDSKYKNVIKTDNSFYDIQKKLDQNESAVIFFSSLLDSRIVHISNKHINVYETVSKIEIDYYLNSLRESLNSENKNEFDFDAAKYLYDILVSSYEENLKPNSNVKIIGSDFSNVPFSVFLREYDESEKNFYKKLITSDWLIKHYNFSRIFINKNHNFNIDYEEKYLGYANPTSYKWSGLPDLSETKKEVTKLGITSNAKKEFILVNNDATKEKFLNQFVKSYERIVIATHAVPPFWNGATFEPSLLFRSKKGNFFLTPSEIVEYNFSSDMVVLSACNTSSSAFVGLFDAFIIAGAQSVVHSNWNLESKFASEFTTSFFEELWINENPKHEAMRDIALKFMNDYSNLDYMHPSFWGNFSIIYSDI